MFLFDVGFQLSYLAVFGIIWMQPKLYAIYKPRFIIDRKIWELVTVSIAAQIGILPLSIYYFHQFPGLFLLSNLVIIPCLGSYFNWWYFGYYFVFTWCITSVFSRFLWFCYLSDE